MLTSPKLIAPLQMALGIQPNLLRARTLPFLAHAFLRVLVGPQALEGRRAHRAAPRPLAELHARHQAWLDEYGPLGRFGAPSLPGGPAADHHVLLADVLHLHPARRAASRLVGRVEPLRDDP